MKTGESTKNTPQKPSRKARALAARLLAVQATYQIMCNKKPVEHVIREYLDHRLSMMLDGEELVAADAEVFTAIMRGVDDRAADLQEILDRNLTNNSRELDTLLQALLLCASWELIANFSADPPILINDYLNVAHSFFDAKTVGLVNGVLDSVAKNFRDPQ